MEQQNEKSRPPKPAPILQNFDCAHLPPHLQEVSRRVGEVAEWASANLPSNAETATGLRKLLEAKDAFVRGRLQREYVWDEEAWAWVLEPTK